MSRKFTWIAVATAVAVVIVVIVMMASVWTGLGDAGISEGGWVALVLGVILTLALGIGLMALVFISSRRGFDEPDGSGR
jgi:cation transporter-like permease